MKKSVIAALTTTLVVGAMSTTFASANPFSDVPADHWAYDSVSTLAHDGVIDGYSDGSFQGNKVITRYEMAQIVAKALAREHDTNKPMVMEDRIIVDRLAVEFGSELENLGVRVANLEKNADNVKWNGEARYTYSDVRHDNTAKDTSNTAEVRLEPTATINNHWVAKARITADIDAKNDSNDNNLSLDRLYAEGNYSNTDVKIGKIPFSVGNKLTFNYDHAFSGAQVDVATSPNMKLELGAGRFKGYEDTTNFNNFNNTVTGDTHDSDVASYQFAGIKYDANKFDAEVAYHNLTSDYFSTIARYGTSTTDRVKILTTDVKYAFDKNIAVEGSYAKNFSQDYNNKAGSAQVDYKSAQAEQKGTWGTYVAYRYLGANAVVDTSYDAVSANQKGWEFGANYTLLPNTVFTAKYFTGTDMNVVGNNDSAKKVFGKVQFFF